MSRSTCATRDAHAPASFKTFLTDIADAYSTGILQRFLHAYAASMR
jgi:adenosylhomocysteine nucleosidase